MLSRFFQAAGQEVKPTAWAHTPGSTGGNSGGIAVPAGLEEDAEMLSPPKAPTALEQRFEAVLQPAPNPTTPSKQKQTNSSGGV